MTREEKKNELIALFTTGAMPIGELIDACFAFADNHPHWISVENELPKGEEAICLLDNGERVIMECDMVDKMNRYSTHHYVTHWMPTPQPPKKGDEQ